MKKLKLAKKILKHKTYYKHCRKQRKNKYERAFDMFKWYLKYGNINTYYNKYGLDIKGLHNPNDYMDSLDAWIKLGRKYKKKKFPYSLFQKKITPKNHYAALTYDKYLFSIVMRDIYGDKVTPKIHAVFNKGVATMPYGYSKTIEECLNGLKEGERLVFKLIGSMQGRGFILVEKRKKGYEYNYGKMNKEEFDESINKGIYIMQDYVVQHSVMNKLNPSAINTVRLVTFRTTEGIKLFSSAVRISSASNTPVDNMAEGGMVVGVNEEKGTLRKFGYFKNKPCVEKHPVTNTVFEGFKIPYYDEAVELVKKCHNVFKDVPTIGWDIAITNEGPVLIESNENWDFPMMQIANGGLKQKFEELYSIIKL